MNEETPHPVVDPAPLRTWEAYEGHIDRQLREHPPTNANVPGLRCKRSSYFDPITRNLKTHIQFRSSEFDRLADGLAPLFMPSGQNGNETTWPSLVPMIQSSIYTPWPTVLTIKERPFEGVLETGLPSYTMSMEDRLAREKSFTKGLFNGEYDDAIHRTTLSGPFRHRYERTLESLFEEARRRPVCLQITTVRESRMGSASITHTIGAILFEKGSRIVVAIYDPIYHFRPTSWYVWPVQQAYCFFKAWGAAFNKPIEILNLGEYCVKSPKGVHCLQYSIDAAYCTSFVLQFFYLYLKAGCPTTEDGLKHAVTASFLVPPTELRRDPCRATNEFRLRTISFLMATLLHTFPLSKVSSTNKIQLLYQLHSIRTTLQRETGIEILPPRLQDYPALVNYEKTYGTRDPFVIVLDSPPVSPRGGGTRRQYRHRSYRASKNARTRSKWSGRIRA